MSHQIKMQENGILRLTFFGDTDKAGVQAFLADIMPFLDQASAAKPLRVLWDDTQGGKASAEMRKVYADLNRSPSLGKVAIFGAARYGRVLGEFVLKFTGRDNIRFFDSEVQALAWLQS